MPGVSRGVAQVTCNNTPPLLGSIRLALPFIKCTATALPSGANATHTGSESSASGSQTGAPVRQFQTHNCFCCPRTPVIVAIRAPSGEKSAATRSAFSVTAVPAGFPVAASDT